jgi:hypothetical protein
MHYYLLFMDWTHRRYVALLLGRSTMDAAGGGVEEEGTLCARSNRSGDDGDERIFSRAGGTPTHGHAWWVSQILFSTSFA